MLNRLFLSLVFAISSLWSATFTLELDKKRALLNQAVLATFTLKYKKGELIKYDFQEPSFKNFFSKKLKVQTIKENGYVYVKYSYLIFAKKSAILTILPQSIKVAKREAKTNFIIWSTLSTRPKKLEVNPSPSLIVGDFKLDVVTNKTTFKKDEPIYLNIKLEGIGNIDAIKPFKLKTKGVILFSSKPILKYSFNNKPKVEFIQKITILANKNFTIEPISFSYYNPEIAMQERLQSKAINIKVETPFNYKKYLYMMMGFLFGVLFVAISLKYKKSKRVVSELEQKIKNAKNQKELYNILLPHINNKELKLYIKKLEENIYLNKKHKVSKKEILKTIL